MPCWPGRTAVRAVVPKPSPGAWEVRGSNISPLNGAPSVIERPPGQLGMGQP